MQLKLRKALLPLHIISKLLCIGPFSLEKLQPSKFGNVITLCEAISYSIFHIWMSNENLSTDSSKNMVRQLIDSYNRFSGLCTFCFLVVATIFVQRKILQLIQNIEHIDCVFLDKFNISVDNHRWKR